MSAEESSTAARTGRAWRLVRGTARLVACAGLAVDAYVHAHLAPQYDPVAATISQGTLFRIEAALAALAALLVLIWHRTLADLFAWLLAAGGLALLLLYLYVDVGDLGPIPNMYEPIWSDDKKLTVAAQAATILATSLLLALRPRTTKPKHSARNLSSPVRRV